MALNSIINFEIRKALSDKNEYSLKKVFKEYSEEDIHKIPVMERRNHIIINARHSYKLFKILMENNLLPSDEGETLLMIENLINDRCRKHAVYLFKNRPDLAVLQYDNWISNALFGAAVNFDFTKEKNKELLSLILKQIPLNTVDKNKDNVVTYALKKLEQKMKDSIHYSYNDQPIKEIRMIINNIHFLLVVAGVDVNYKKENKSTLEIFNDIDTSALSGRKLQNDLRLYLEEVREKIASEIEKKYILENINNTKINYGANKKRL